MVTESFKQDNFADGMKCPITGDVMTWDETEVDHAAPMTFARLVRDFITRCGIDVSKVEYDHSGQGVAFKDYTLDLSWFFYHDAFASLRLVSSYANRILLREAS